MTNFLPDWVLGLFLLVVGGLITEGIHRYWHRSRLPPPMSPIVALVPAGERPGRE